MRIVFICTGNICRSPMAEGVLRSRMLELGRDDVVVTSMGIHGLESQPATPYAQQVALEYGVDISAHRSRPLVVDELVAADLILAMELVQKHFVTLFFPQVADRVYLLGAWPEDESRKANIHDPMGKSLRTYKSIFEIIRKHINRILPDLMDTFGRDRGGA